jgi:hypothetical protein
MNVSVNGLNKILVSSRLVEKSEVILSVISDDKEVRFVLAASATDVQSQERLFWNVLELKHTDRIEVQLLDPGVTNADRRVPLETKEQRLARKKRIAVGLKQELMQAGLIAES